MSLEHYLGNRESPQDGDGRGDQPRQYERMVEDVLPDRRRAERSKMMAAMRDPYVGMKKYTLTAERIPSGTGEIRECDPERHQPSNGRRLAVEQH